MNTLAVEVLVVGVELLSGDTVLLGNISTAVIGRGDNIVPSTVSSSLVNNSQVTGLGSRNGFRRRTGTRGRLFLFGLFFGLLLRLLFLSSLFFSSLLFSGSLFSGSLFFSGLLFSKATLGVSVGLVNTDRVEDLKGNVTSIGFSGKLVDVSELSEVKTVGLSSSSTREGLVNG